MTVKILALGNMTMYAPRTPEIAPDAPTAGICPPPVETAKALWARAAAAPQPTYIRMYFILPNLSSILSPKTNKNIMLRSEERRVGKECRSWRTSYQQQ